MHHHHKLVLPIVQLAGQVKLCRVVCALGIADKGAVDVQIHAAGNAQKRDDLPLVGIVDIQKTAVDADKVVLLAGVLPLQADAGIAAQPRKDAARLAGGGDHRRLVGELVADVDIKRFIVPAELPAGRNIELIKMHCIGVKFNR